MAQKWYQKATVQAAMVGGCFVIAVALITTLWRRHELINLRRAEFETEIRTVSEYAQIESEHKALVSGLEALADAYRRLSEDLRLTREQRDYYRKLYEETKARLGRQKELAEAATAKRIQADSALKELEERISESRVKYVTAIEERDRCKEMYENTKTELVQAKAALAELRKRLDEAEVGTTTVAKVTLRCTALTNFSVEDAKTMLVEKDFFHRDHNPDGKGIENKYELKVIESNSVVIDHVTDLMWQQSGSGAMMNYAKAEKYVGELNKKRFAGYNDWRLPTLEEAMSLMEPSEMNGYLYIDPMFCKVQRWVWTADKESAGVAWSINFKGYISIDYVAHNIYVRAVRRGQS